MNASLTPDNAAGMFAVTAATPAPTDADSEMRIRKSAAAIDLAGDLFDQATARIHEFHRAISDKPIAMVNAALGPAAKPVTTVHNAITDFVYGSVRAVGWSVLKAGAFSLKMAAPVMQFKPETDRFDRNLDAVASAASGLLGDKLAASGNELAPVMGFYKDRQKLPADAMELAGLYPDAQSHLVIFVHGLCCNEDCWWMYAKHNDGMSYGDFLQMQGGRTALYIRYNTGLQIRTNGRRLMSELKALVAAWPVKVERITLVGHSMGGLVSRVLIDEAQRKSPELMRLIEDLVCIGSPHEGAPLARISAKGEKLLDAFDLSRPISKVLGVRSRGVRNLEQGLGTTPVSRYTDVRVHLIGSTVGTFEQPGIAETVGDGLVQLSSSLSADAVPQAASAYEGRHHMHLLNDAKIREQLDQLTRPVLTQ